MAAGWGQAGRNRDPRAPDIVQRPHQADEPGAANRPQTPYPPAMVHARFRAPQAQGASGGCHRTYEGFSERIHVQRDPAGALPQIGDMAERYLNDWASQ